MKYGKLELKRRLKDVLRKRWTDTWIIDLIDSLWRDEWTNRTSGFELAGGIDASIAFDDETRIFSIEPVEKKYTFYQYSYRVAFFKRRLKEEIEIPDEEGLYMVYFDHDPDDPDLEQRLFVVKNPDAGQVEHIYLNRVIIAWIYWAEDLGEAIYFGDSRHGSEWSPPIHWWMHKTLNSQRQEGMAVAGITVDGDGSQESDVQYGITAGKIWHCDFIKDMPEILNTDSLPVLYFDTDGYPRFAVQSASKHINTGSGRLGYNGGGVIVEASEGYWLNYHLFATNCTINPYIAVMGQSQYESYAQAMGSANAEVIFLKTLIPHVNLMYLGTFIYETSDEFGNPSKSRIVSFHDEVGVTDVFTEDHPQFPIEFLKYRKKGIDYYVTDIPKPNGLLTGGIVSWLGDLDFAISPAAYYIGGKLYETGSESVTLDPADTTDPRIDILVVNTQGEVHVITGTPAPNPQKPTPDPTTEIELTDILVPANATDPENITEEIIYDENVEWAGVGSGVIIDLDNTTSPYRGAKCMDVGAIGNADTITFTAGSAKNVADYETLILFLKLKVSAAKQHTISAQFLLGGSPVSNAVFLSFNISLANAWQNISLAVNQLTFISATFDAVQFKWIKAGAQQDFSGFYMDYIKLEKGITQPVPSTDRYVTDMQFDPINRTLTLHRSAGLPSLVVTIPGGTGGEDGREVELSVDGGYIVWRYVGETTWINLISLSTLTGPAGPDGPAGDDGREIELRENAGYVEWRYVGDVSWTQLYGIPTGGGGGTLQITGLTLLSTGWSLVSGLYEYALSNVNITADSIVDVIPANADVSIVKAAEILPETNSSSGSVKIYSVNAPTANISVTINITEKV